jgi:hypothetical protein
VIAGAEGDTGGNNKVEGPLCRDSACPARTRDTEVPPTFERTTTRRFPILIGSSSCSREKRFSQSRGNFSKCPPNSSTSRRACVADWQQTSSCKHFRPGRSITASPAIVFELSQRGVADFRQRYIKRKWR